MFVQRFLFLLNNFTIPKELEKSESESRKSQSIIYTQKDKSFLDTESVFGYNWDTVTMFTLVVLIITTFLFRLGILHIHL
jgi:hypothetical protein